MFVCVRGCVFLVYESVFRNHVSSCSKNVRVYKTCWGLDGAPTSQRRKKEGGENKNHDQQIIRDEMDVTDIIITLL